MKESRTKKRDEILAMEKINDALQDKIRFEAVFRIRIEKEFMNILQGFFGLKRMMNRKKTYVAFFFWCKNDSKAFLKEYPVVLILIPEVWTEEMKLFALHISYSTKSRFIHSFPFFFGPDPDPQIYADPDPDRAKKCGSGSETLVMNEG